jgi:hypothetical protein
MPSSENTTVNNVWGSNAPEGAEETITLASGQTCVAKKVTIESMIEAGILDQVDSLTATVDRYTRKVKGGKVADGTPVLDPQIMQDGSALKLMITMADRALPHIVVNPPVALHFSEKTVGQTKVTKKLSEADRQEMRNAQPNLVFTDQIGLEDKMELFQWAMGGMEAFQSFRDEPTTDVGGVVHVARPARAPQRRTRSK